MNIVCRRVMVVIFCIIASITLVACPPKPPCDEEIKHPEEIEAAILSNSLIQQLSSELSVYEINISPCYVENKVSSAIIYALPVSYSEYQLAYRDSLVLAYHKDGTLEMSGYTHPTAFEYKAILDYFKERIHQIESNPRIREVLTNTDPDTRNNFILLSAPTIFRKGGNEISYNFIYGVVSGYTLSNNIDWQEFPEIEQAHAAIREHLLVGEYSDCLIGRGERHSYTGAMFHGASNGPWILIVAVTCDKDLNEAVVRIYPDGSYDGLRFQYQPGGD